LPDALVRDDGIDALIQLRQKGHRVPVVFLTMHRDARFARRALEAGASGCVLEHSASIELTAVDRQQLGRAR
jgi:DNA-binding NarL/FixJ family response regulator